MNLLKKIFNKPVTEPAADPLIFVHIPKTAGTSFRLAAQNLFGPDTTLFDYGPGSPETSQLVLEHVYSKPDLFFFRKKILEMKCAFLGGHFRTHKYSSLFSHDSIITFIRNPIERVVSNFNHAVKIQGYDKDLQSFSRTHQNAQAKFIGDYPLELLGFVGITERYDESINLINSLYSLSLEHLSLNTNQESWKTIQELSSEDHDLITRLNDKDQRIYAMALSIFQERKRILALKRPYTYCCIQFLNKKMVTGWAFRKGCPDPLEIEIFKDNDLQGSVIASEPRPGLMLFNPERAGFIGFSHRLKKSLNHDDRILCRIADTGQMLTGPDRIIACQP